MPGDVWPEVVAHRERLLRIARRRCPTREDAEDVVSEAMLRCATFEGLDAARMEQFLTAVTVRLCADLHRKAARRARAVVTLASDPDVAPGPEEELYGGVDEYLLRGLLAALPARQRAVLADRARGLSVQQIARRHALTYKAAESMLARARQSMRAALATSASVVVTVRAALRPRRLAVLALPVVTLAVGSGVVRIPLLDGPGRPVRKPYVTALTPVPPRSAADLARRVQDAPPARGVRTGRPPAAAVPPSRPIDPVAPRRPTRHVAVGDRSLAQTSITLVQPGSSSTRETVRNCTKKVWVRAGVSTEELDPGEKPVWGTQGCG